MALSFLRFFTKTAFTIVLVFLFAIKANGQDSTITHNFSATYAIKRTTVEYNNDIPGLGPLSQKFAQNRIFLNYGFKYKRFFATTASLGFNNTKNTEYSSVFLQIGEQFHFMPLFVKKKCRFDLYIPVYFGLGYHFSPSSNFFRFDGLTTGIGTNFFIIKNLGITLEVQKQFFEHKNFPIFFKYGLIFQL